jgi:hypothetical protein
MPSLNLYLAEYSGRPSGWLRRALYAGARHVNDLPVLSLMVWILKREVRAIRGCLGMHRR